mgnify:CR=1 FL=1
MKKNINELKKIDPTVRWTPFSRRAHKVNAMSFALLCKLMVDGTRTCYELAEESGLHITTVYDWVRELHRQGLIHLCMWEGEGRNSSRIFKFGPGKDVPRPFKPREKVHAEYRARQKAKALIQRMAGTMENV